MAKAKVSKIDLQNGTDRTLYVTWTWGKQSQTDKYDIRWYYGTGDGVRFIGSEQQVTITNAQLQSTYTPPENAKTVKFQVKPIAKTRKVNDKDVAYWTAEWSTEVSYTFGAEPPTKPPTPIVTIDNYTLTASVQNAYINATEVQFQIIKDDIKVIHTGIAKSITYAASYSYTIEAGSKYKSRCRGKRGDLYGEWSDYSGNVETIPSASSGITTYYASTETSVFLAWSPVSSAKTYDIEYATREDYLGGSNSSTTINNISSTSYTMTGLESGQKYYFRVRAVNSIGSSGWTDVVSITLGSKPAAPTTWSSTTTAVVGENIVLYWVHNAEDGSKETKAEVERDIDGVVSVATVEKPEDDENNSIFTIDTSNSKFSEGSVIKWRVRTAGITGEYGEWSIQRVINVYAPATLSLELTDNNGASIDSLTSFPFYIKGVAGPANQTPIGYNVTITTGSSYETIDEVGNVKMIREGDVVYSKFYDITRDLLLEITAGSIDLENNVTYTVTCMSTMDTGLSTQQSIDFKVAWSDQEYEPNAEIGYDPKTLSAFIRPYCANDDGILVSGITLSVYRREYDGRFIEIGSNLKNANNTFVTDPHPSLDYARYRIVAIDDNTGAVSYSDIPGYPVGEKAVIIQWDETWRNFDDLGEMAQEEPTWSGSMLKLPYNIDVSDNNTVDVSLIKYIGRSHPVSYYGTQIDSTATWNVEIDKKDKNTLYALRRLAIWMGDVYVREPSGSGYWASISVSFSQTHCELVIPVTLNITRVEGGI